MPSRDWGLCGDFPAFANVGRKISRWGELGKMWGFGPICGGKPPQNMTLTLTHLLTTKLRLAEVIKGYLTNHFLHFFKKNFPGVRLGLANLT